MIELGMKVKCRVTGFVGIAVAESSFLFGCRRVGVQAKINKEGKVDEVCWFDEPQLEVIGKKKVIEPGGREVGGPAHSIPRLNANPKRFGK